MSTVTPSHDPACLRDRLISAAELIVTREGVANLTLDAVARDAGVSKGGLLYHFPSKSALIIAIVERMATHCESEHAKAIAGNDGRAGAFTRAYLDARSEPLSPEEVPFHIALITAAGTDPQILEPFRKRFAAWQVRLESDGIDPVQASIVRLAIDGLCLGTLLGVPVPTGTMRAAILKRLRQMTEADTAAVV